MLARHTKSDRPARSPASDSLAPAARSSRRIPPAPSDTIARDQSNPHLAAQRTSLANSKDTTAAPAANIRLRNNADPSAVAHRRPSRDVQGDKPPRSFPSSSSPQRSEQASATTHAQSKTDISSKHSASTAACVSDSIESAEAATAVRLLAGARDRSSNHSMSHSRKPAVELSPAPADVAYFERKQLKAAREIESLKLELENLGKEHKKLAANHQRLQELYDGVVGETKTLNTNTTPASIETFLQVSRRRVALLKSQNTQLLRQVAVYRRDLDTRECFVYDVTGSAKHIRSKLAQILKEQADDPKQKNSNRECIIECIKLLDALYKHATRGVQDRLGPSESEPGQYDVEFVSDFIAAGSNDLRPKASIDAVASGRIDHINLHHVGQVESEMHALLGDLVQLDKCIETSIEPNTQAILGTHVRDVIERSARQTRLVLDSLISLQVLVSAPPLPEWAKVSEAMKRCPRGVHDILAAVPHTIRARIREPVEDMLKSHAAVEQLSAERTSALSKELEFHRDTYTKYNAMIADVVDRLDQRRKRIVSLLKQSIDPLIRLQTRLGSLELTRDAVTGFLEAFEHELDETLSRIRDLDAMSVGSGSPPHQPSASS